jgi:lactate permease
MWGACLVGVFIFGLAYVFNYSGMAASLAKGFASFGTAFIIVAPILGFIGVALSGSNTSTNAMFGKFQALVGAQLGMPALLLPSLNSVGAEIGKPIAPQTASVGVSTSKFVRKEGDVIRHNMGWTFILLAYLIVIAILAYVVRPAAMMLKSG